MSNKVKTKTVNLGRLPVFCGTWNDGVGYHKYNIVTYYGSSFINLVEGNLKYPANITFDSSNRLESYKFEYDDGSWTGWMFVSNSFDASIYAMQMGDYAKYEGDKVSSTIDNMQDQIDEIIRNQSNITISLNPSVIYAGVASNVQINASINTIGTVSTFTLSRNGSHIAQSTSTSVSGTTSVNETVNQTIVADALIKTSHVTKNATLYVVYPIYYGGGDAYTDATTKASPRTSPAGTYNVNVPSNGKYVFFNVPASMSINKATVSGFDMPLNAPVNVTIDGQSYKSYKSVNTYDAGTLTVVLS